MIWPILALAAAVGTAVLLSRGGSDSGKAPSPPPPPTPPIVPPMIPSTPPIVPPMGKGANLTADQIARMKAVGVTDAEILMMQQYLAAGSFTPEHVAKSVEVVIQAKRAKLPTPTNVKLDEVPPFVPGVLDDPGTPIDPGGLPSQAQFPAYAKVTASILNLRKGPSMQESVVGAAPQGATVIVRGPMENGFVPIRYDGPLPAGFPAVGQPFVGGQVRLSDGWANGAYLERVQSAGPASGVMD